VILCPIIDILLNNRTSQPADHSTRNNLIALVALVIVLGAGWRLSLEHFLLALLLTWALMACIIAPFVGEYVASDLSLISPRSAGQLRVAIETRERTAQRQSYQTTQTNDAEGAGPGGLPDERKPSALNQPQSQQEKRT
jgi:hypothetical protein